MNVTLKVNDKVVAKGQVPKTTALRRTTVSISGATSDRLLSLDYFDQAPFAFNGTLGTTRIT
jgi:hypothetical protein